MTTITKLTLSTIPEAFFGSVRAVSALVLVWNARARQRRSLGQLDDHILRDIGLDRMSAQEQSTRPFWKD